MPKVVVAILLLFGSVSFSQEIEKKPPKVIEDNSSTGRFSVTASPLALLDVYNGSTYRAGIQFRPLNNIALGAEGGGYIDKFTDYLTIYYNTSGYHARFRVSYFPERLDNFSFGLEYQFKYQKLSYTDSTDLLPTFQADVRRRVNVFNVFVSYDHNFTERFFLDIQAGVGLRYRDIHNNFSETVNNGSYVWPWDSLHGGRVTTQKQYIPNVSLNFRLGYVIVKNK